MKKITILLKLIKKQEKNKNFLFSICKIKKTWRVTSEKITKDKKIIIVLIILVLISSIIFIEYKNRDLTHDRESFLISQEIIKLADRTNTFNQDGYVKTAILITDWPNIPDPNEIGKLKHDFDKFPTEKYNSIKKFILDFCFLENLNIIIIRIFKIFKIVFVFSQIINYR